MGCRIQFWQPSDLPRENRYDGHMLTPVIEFKITSALDFLRP